MGWTANLLCFLPVREFLAAQVSAMFVGVLWGSHRNGSHFTCKSIFMCSRIHPLHKGALATSWLFEVPPGARSGTLCMVTSGPWIDTHVGDHRGQKSCLFLLVPAWLATRGNLHSNIFHTLFMLQFLWRSFIVMRLGMDLLHPACMYEERLSC